MARDFYAKRISWGREVTDARGELLLEVMDSAGLSCLNDRRSPTLVRSTGESYIDVTFGMDMGLRRTLGSP